MYAPCFVDFLRRHVLCFPFLQGSGGIVIITFMTYARNICPKLRNGIDMFSILHHAHQDCGRGPQLAALHGLGVTLKIRTI